MLRANYFMLRCTRLGCPTAQRDARGRDRAALNRSLRKLTALTPEQRETIDLMTRSIVNKIAHGPVSELRRQAGQPDGGPMVDAIRRVFRLRESAPK